jgi:hypothetical protein
MCPDVDWESRRGQEEPMRRRLCQLDHTKMIQSFLRYLPLSLSLLLLSSLLFAPFSFVYGYYSYLFPFNPTSFLFFVRTARANVGIHFVMEISIFTQFHSMCTQKGIMGAGKGHTCSRPAMRPTTARDPSGS